MHILPERVKPAQVRCALTSVIRRQLKSPANFDKNGWLRVGFTGEQIEISESYINTGSVYLCAFGLSLHAAFPFFLPLPLSVKKYTETVLLYQVCHSH